LTRIERKELRNTRIAEHIERNVVGRESSVPWAPIAGVKSASPHFGPLVRAVERNRRIARSEAPEGIERVLTQHDAARIGLLVELGDDQLARITRLVGEGESAADAIVLKALSARCGALLRGHERALEELEAFAARVRELDPQEILRRATVLDLDSTQNASTWDPIKISDRRGVIHPRGDGDQRTDNDGLYQRFTASCGPTVIQLMLAQADPAYAFALHDAGLHRDLTGDVLGRFQRSVLERYEGVAVGQAHAQLRARLRNALGRLVAAQVLSADDALALREYAANKAKLSPGAARALDVVRKRHDGFPSGAELTRLRRAKLPERDEGLSFESFRDALARYVTPLTGVVYAQTPPEWGFARGRARRHLDAVAQALRQGIDVPFGISEPAHWMLLTAVGGRKPNRRFLASDPLGGRTAWVKEDDLVSGRFVRDQFQLCIGKERGYIDSFFLPQRRSLRSG
jgi:hypothetical protein